MPSPPCALRLKDREARARDSPCAASMKSAQAFQPFIVFNVAIFEHPGWMSSGNGAAGDVADHHAAGLDNGAFLDGHSAQDDHPAPQPDIVLDRDVFVEVRAVIGDGRAVIKVVILGDHQAFRTRMKVVANNNLAPLKFSCR